MGLAYEMLDPYIWQTAHRTAATRDGLLNRSRRAPDLPPLLRGAAPHRLLR